ncbi:MAG: VIT domain-containing protein [Deltaproteobacteria bacterium]
MSTVAASVLLLALGAPAAEAPHFVVSGSDTLPLRATQTDVHVAGVIAHVRVRQRYENDGANAIEAQYVFAGSTQAAVFGMTMKIGERTIVAKIDERARARRKYETAKDEGRAAALLEQSRPNVLSMNVANIMPGDVVEVTLDYTELLVPERGVYALVIPGVVGARFDGEGGREAWNENPNLPDHAPGPKFGLRARIVGGAPVRAVKCTTHRIAPQFTGRDVVDVQVLDEDGSDRDFILRYRLDGDAIQTGVLLYEAKGEKFFAATIQPPEHVAPTMIPPREYVFVVDVSGSMRGFPTQTTVTLLEQLLADLRPQDRFNVVLFAGGQTLFAPRSVRATRDQVERAVEVVRHLRGGGGTELLEALNTALGTPREDTIATSFVIITDGYVNVEREAYALVRRERGRANVFTFGVGRSVNRHLVESLARAGSGRPFVVTNASEARDAAKRFARYVSAPVMTNVRVRFDGFDAYDVEPTAQPDLFGERPLVVFGKYRGAAQGRIQVRGDTGMGAFSRDVDIANASPSDDLVALRYLWARERVAALTEGDTTEHQEAVTALGLAYGLMTPFTSFVAIDDRVRRHGADPVVTVRQPLPRASGSFGKSGGLLGTLRSNGSGGGALNDVYGNGALGGGGLADGFSGVVRGSLSKDRIAQVFRRKRGAFKSVFEKMLKSDPTLSGKVVLELTVGPDGRVVAARIRGDAAKQKRWAGLVAVAKKMRFPAPAGGGTIHISYPFIFRPQ